MVRPRAKLRFPWSTGRARLLPLAVLALALTSCSFIEIDSPLTIFEPAGPFAERIDGLFWPVFWTAVVVFFLVQGAILFAVFAFRDRPGRKEPKQTHGNAALEITWTVIPTLILAVLAVPTVQAVFDLTKCGDDAMVIEVIGHQWWFEYVYPEHGGITTANVLVMPEDQEVCATMTSEDVMHNFWIPALNGKRYLVPGQTTILRLQADEPGEYWGHCAEFCGLSHSLMRARAQVVTAEEFDAWIAAQSQPAEVPAEGTPEWEGLQVFLNKGCTACHAVDFADGSGVDDVVRARGTFRGPNLTHFASRHVFAGAYLPSEDIGYDEALTEWLANPPLVKPGSFMPDLGLTGEEISDLIAWLKSNT
ncbi:MAG: cytochrome c oxidase subunit II [Acidimicrobiia bacterium]|nr:cytochrome c oxidase subunit II [Acidimicrobiia bacterium]MDH4306139.1 cytochrome c oxidase subunit II [Acidimicrobiia bacterium]MDH5292120.1 cytochrome c oxidase subunit II [Acidimicrobiia bacterium]